MDIIDFYRTEQKRIHSWLRLQVNDLSLDEWHHTIGAGNHIAFLLWHCVRTEDNILRFIVQGRPPIWNEDNWHERLKLPPRVQGTGMSTEEAHMLRIENPELFLHYAEKVWLEFENYLATIPDGGAELSARIVKVKPIGEMSALQAIGQICITHLYIHCGEISFLLGTLGKKGLPI